MALGLSLGIGLTRPQTTVAAAAAASPAITVMTEQSSSGVATFATDATFTLAANKTYIIEANLLCHAASGTRGIQLKLNGVPAGATGYWTVVGGSGAAAQSIHGALSDTIATPAFIGTTTLPVCVRIHIVVAGTGGNMDLQHAPVTDTNAMTVEAGSHAILRTSPTVTAIPGNITADSDTTYDQVFELSFAAGKSTWVDIDIPYSSAATTTGIAIQCVIAGTGATFIAGLFGDNVSAIRRDDTVFTAGTAKLTGNVVRIRALVTTTTNSATLTINARSEVNTSAITILAGGFARQMDVTGSVLTVAMDAANATTTETARFSHTVAVGKKYFINSLASFISSSSTVGISTDIDGIPANATAAFVSMAGRGSAATGWAVKRDSTDQVQPTSSGATEEPWMDSGTLVTTDTGGTFTQGHAAETTGTVTVKAGSFAVAEEVV